MTECYVGFDTSNYTTSIAVCDADGRVLANLKKPLPVKEGQRGLRQSDAVFEHVRNLPALCEELRVLLRMEELRPVAVGVSTTPRDAEGSYMPCFLSGKAAAASFSAALDLPLYSFSHQNGHVMAAMYSSGRDFLGEERFLAFHVSGGTTEALLCVPKGDSFAVTLVGETEDINAGQAIDRVGVAMGLSFPAGREMEALASAYHGKPMKHPITVRDCRCSLSGVENLAFRMISEGRPREEVAAFVFDFIRRTLTEMGKQAMARYGTMPVLFAGGVMSNCWMRKKLSEQFDAAFSEPQFSADNAAGVALLCRRRHSMREEL